MSSPTNLRSKSVSPTAIELMWDKPQDFDPVQYKIQYNNKTRIHTINSSSSDINTVLTDLGKMSISTYCQYFVNIMIIFQNLSLYMI